MNLFSPWRKFFLKFWSSQKLLLNFFWCCLYQLLCSLLILFLLLKSLVNSRNISFCYLCPNLFNLVSLKFFLLLLRKHLEFVSLLLHISCNCFALRILLLVWRYLIRIEPESHHRLTFNSNKRNSFSLIFHSIKVARKLWYFFRSNFKLGKLLNILDCYPDSPYYSVSFAFSNSFNWLVKVRF